MMVDILRRARIVNPEAWVVRLSSEWDDDEVDWGSGSDLPVDSSCDLESPEECESCQ